MRGKKSAPKLGECCEGLKILVSRAHPQWGVSIAPMFSFGFGGHVRSALIASFPKSKDKTVKFPDATYLVLNHCPVCGAKLAVDEKKSEGKAVH